MLDRPRGERLLARARRGLSRSARRERGGRAASSSRPLPGHVLGRLGPDAHRGPGARRHGRLRRLRTAISCARSSPSSRPLVAALPGHAIAGGLIVAAARGRTHRRGGEGGARALGGPARRAGAGSACIEIFRHAVGPRAMERLAATGENLSVEDARAIGLVDRVVPAGTLRERAFERARAPRRPSPAPRTRRSSRAARRRARAVRSGARPRSLPRPSGSPTTRRIRALVARLTKKG